MIEMFRKKKPDAEQVVKKVETPECAGCGALLSGKLNLVKIIEIGGQSYGAYDYWGVGVLYDFTVPYRQEFVKDTESYYCGKCKKPYDLLIKVFENGDFHRFAFRVDETSLYHRRSWKQVKLKGKKND